MSVLTVLQLDGGAKGQCADSQLWVSFKPGGAVFVPEVETGL